jgi:hypothetical protein
MCAQRLAGEAVHSGSADNVAVVMALFWQGEATPVEIIYQAT